MSDSRYRLTGSELNAAAFKIAKDFADQAGVSLNEDDRFHHIPSHGKVVVLCPMSKDAQTKSNEKTLPLIFDIIDEYLNSHRVGLNDPEHILLLPLRFCRGYGYLPVKFPLAQRKHAVLAILNLNTRHLQIHDSQDDTRKGYYPDKLAEMWQRIGATFVYDPQTDNCPHNKQRDNDSCGWYVLKYIESFLENGHADALKDIDLGNILSQYQHKHHFLKKVFGLELNFNKNPSIQSSSDEEIWEWDYMEREIDVKRPAGWINQGFFSPPLSKKITPELLARVKVST